MEKLYSLSYLHDLGRPDLQALCKKHGLKAMGKNAALISTLSRIRAPGNEPLKKELAKRKGAAPSNVFADDKLKQAAGLPVRRSTRRVPSRPGAGPVQIDAKVEEEPSTLPIPKKNKAPPPPPLSTVAPPVEADSPEPAPRPTAAGPLRRGRSSNRVDPISTAARPFAKRDAITSPASSSSAASQRYSSVVSDVDTVVASPSGISSKSPSPPPSPSASAFDEAAIHSLIESAVRNSEARLRAQQEELNERVNKLESTMKTLNTAQDAAKETLSQLSQAVKDVQQPPPRPVLLRTLPEVEYPSSLAFHARIELRLEQELWQKERQKAVADQQALKPASSQNDVLVKKPATALITSPTTTPPGSPPMGARSPTRRFQDNVLENADLPPQNVIWDEDEEEFHNILLSAMSDRQESALRSDTPEPEEELKRRPQRGHVRSNGTELLKAALSRSRGVRRLKRQLWLHENRGRLPAGHPWKFIPQHLLPDDGEQLDPLDDSELLRWKDADSGRTTTPMVVDGDDYEDEDEDEEDEDADADADAEMEDPSMRSSIESISFDPQPSTNSGFMQQQGAFALQNWDSPSIGTELQMSNPTYAGDIGFSMSTFATDQMPVSTDNSSSLHGVVEHFGAQMFAPSQTDGTLTMQAGGVQAQSGVIDMTAQGGGLHQQVVGYHQLVLNDGTQLHQQYAINTSLIPPSSPQSQSPLQSDLDNLLAWNPFGQLGPQEQFAIDPRLTSLPSPSAVPSFDASTSLLSGSCSSPTMSFDTGLTSPSGSASGPDAMQVDGSPGMNLLGMDPIPMWDDSAMYMDMSSFNMFSGSIWTPEKPQGSARVYDGPSVVAWRAWAAPHLRLARDQLRRLPELQTAAAANVVEPLDVGLGVSPEAPEPLYRARERSFHDKIEDLVSVALGVLPEHGRGSQQGPPVWINEPPTDPKRGHPGEYVWVPHDDEDGPK